MNLFINPSLPELRKLLTKIDNSAFNHNLVVDYDGEVLIDPDLEQPEIDLNRFKLRIPLHATGKDLINRGSTWMRILLNKLIYCWENNLNFPGSAFN
jgi:hypothetical protein